MLLSYRGSLALEFPSFFVYILYILIRMFLYLKFMKKIILLLFISILFQSCSSYKSVDFNNIVIEKKRKFEIEKIDSSKLKGRLVSKNENSIVLENNKGIQTIQKSEIQELKVKKFSILKTATGALGTYFILLIGAVAVILLGGGLIF